MAKIREQLGVRKIIFSWNMEKLLVSDVVSTMYSGNLQSAPSDAPAPVSAVHTFPPHAEFYSDQAPCHAAHRQRGHDP